ncbi:uncharacterized protein LOC143604329 [Bidens hawaiensis]|uniref:uncharacterized protein LOC143604329 n=1 Tax=Bidens hawaiensis TaxID=980011 RepID=UPI00404AFA28
MVEDETIDQFVGKITCMLTKATSLGHVFEQDVLVKKLRDAVPDKYFQLVASIQQSVDLDSMMFEYAVGRLKAFEERLRGRERASISQGDQKTVFLNKDGVIPKHFETEQMEKDVWYLENGALNHMTGNKAHFYELHEKVTGTVKFGDESCIDIRGKGSVLIEGKTGE